LPLQVVESLRLYRRIAGQISTLIDGGEFPVGSRLPPERELAKLLGVSRTSVREAILALKIEGRVEVRVGTGIFVAAPAETQPQEGGPGPFELLSARELIEGETAALAARSIDDETLARLRDTIAVMRANDGDFGERDAADRAFHVLIAQASGNSALALVVGMLWDQRSSGLWPQIEGYFHTPALRATTLDDHQAIVDTLAARDAKAARVAMCRHLHHVAHEFQRRWELLDKNIARRGTAAQPATAPASP
jgi:DNA-binding FadR family transcriptional regulator